MLSEVAKRSDKRSSEKTSSKKKEELVTMRYARSFSVLSLSMLHMRLTRDALSARSVKKPKSLEEVWQGAAVLISDALRKLDEGITRPRFMATYS